MEIYEVFYDITRQGEKTVRGQWTSEGITIRNRTIPIEDIDWCRMVKDTRRNRLTFTLRNGGSVSLMYDESEKEKANRVKKGVRAAVDKIDDAIAYEENKNYCEVFTGKTFFGKTIVRGTWTYEGMHIGKRIIPAKRLHDCKITISSYGYSILFELKNGSSEKFQLLNEEQHEQARKLVMMVNRQIEKFDSGEWE